ncbi:MAG TPA: LptF/LptG family permease [Holophagaceae bacterium]|nr:LptF/LptG family permease [Holophagaceae bacterium]
MPILTRYILRRWAWPILGALLFYGLLLLANETVQISREIFVEGAPLRWLPPLLATSLPEILGTVLPMAAVLGGLMGTQQLLEGSELTAAQGLGAGTKTWTRPWLILASALVLLASLNFHVVMPAMAGFQKTIRARMADEARTRFLRPGSPPWYPPNSPDTSIWVDSLGEVHLMDSGPSGVRHIVARGMNYSIQHATDGSGAVELRLQDLQGVLVQPGSEGVVHIKQEQQILRFVLPSAAKLLPPTPLRNRATAEVWRLKDRVARVELVRRFALPLASAGLLLLGIALGFGHPRFYRGGAILKSMAVIIIYYILLKAFENSYEAGRVQSVLPMLLLPFAFLGAGAWLLWRRLQPHRPSRVAKLLRHWVLAPIYHHSEPFWARVQGVWSGLSVRFRHHRSARSGVFIRWATYGWGRNWAAAIGTLLLLDFLVEYANLAGDLSEHHVHVGTFLAYWLWKLPPFLAVVLPIAFLLGSLLALSEAALRLEWVALKSGGISLVQWLWKAKWAWGPVLVLSFLLQVWVAPVADAKSDALYRRMLERPAPATGVRPWLYLGQTGVLWHLAPEGRWGFPLKAPGQAPILLCWSRGETFSEALPWDASRFVQGPAADKLFPDRTLRDAPTPDQVSTFDLFAWQRWAPDSERAHLLWSRLLGWLAGPLLLFGLLSFAFPGPRSGRGAALGFGMVGGLVFLGLQTLFSGAAKAGELPPLWGVLAPMLLLAGFGLLRLPRLRT